MPISKSDSPPLLFIVGPTAVGKSALALNLALAFNGEIVNADSRQIYRFMDIGTAKPSLEDRAKVPHHLIDILDPDQGFSLSTFLELAQGAIADIQGRGKLAIVCGGTGQYIQALLGGWKVPKVPPDPQLRAKLEDEANRGGTEALYQRLLEIDPESASRIHQRNLRRIIRALEIYEVTGTPASELRARQYPPFRSLIIGLTTSREELYTRIDHRVDDMLKNGLVEEVRHLHQLGYSASLPSMSSMGYKEIILLLKGDLSLEEAAQRIKYETHRFARRQYAWFRLRDPRIQWLETGPDVNHRAEVLVSDFLREQRGCDTIGSAMEEKPQ